MSDKAVSPSSIVDSFFNDESTHVSEKPTLEFQPPSRSNPTDLKDSTWGKFRQYGLPSEMEVEAAVRGSAPTSGAFKVTETELVERMLDARGDSGGPRAVEVEKWTRDVVKRLCVEKEDGYLDWRRK